MKIDGMDAIARSLQHDRLEHLPVLPEDPDLDIGHLLERAEQSVHLRLIVHRPAALVLVVLRSQQRAQSKMKGSDLNLCQAASTSITTKCS